jgi:hypothetical protein
MTPFGPALNLIMKVVLWTLALSIVAIVLLVWGWPRTDYWTGRSLFGDQIVPFSHKHDVGGLGLDCRYYHARAATPASSRTRSSSPPV